ncbi:MAG: aldo/keto reductase [Pirellulales bacterium]|nr:aldo/keto reductase [Pirellulales bacterium]
MEMRPFGKSGIQVSGIGIGTWQIGGQWGPEFTDETALEILRAAADQGVTFIDTADIYGLGRSETVIGKFLRENRGNFFVATKLGRNPHPGWPHNFTPRVIREHTENSLLNLGVDCLDLTQLHCVPQEELESGVVFEALEDLKQAGKIRNYGASVESMEEALICLRYPGCASLQIIFNIFRQKPISTLFDQAQRQGVAIIVRLPLASGLLSGKMTKDRVFDENDHRNYNRDGQQFNVGETFAGLPYEAGVDLANQVAALVPPGMTMTQMALRWCLDFDAVTTVIPGARSPEQAIENSQAGHLPRLPSPLHDRLAALYHTEVEPLIRGKY